jgi:hypothetical protein
LASASKHVERVCSLGCILCRHIHGEYVPAEPHHLFDPSQRSDWLVAPLCPEHHRRESPNGFHGLGGEPGFRRRYKLGEVELLGMTIEALAKS